MVSLLLINYHNCICIIYILCHYRCVDYQAYSQVFTNFQNIDDSKATDVRLVLSYCIIIKYKKGIIFEFSASKECSFVNVSTLTKDTVGVNYASVSKFIDFCISIELF